MVEKKGQNKKRDKDFYSFEEVLRELNLTEVELKKMVSEGELRAFREADQIKFRKEDVDSIKRGRITEPTVRIPPEELSQEDTFVEETPLTEEMSFTDTDLAVAEIEEKKAPFIEEETGLVTAPLAELEEPEETVIEEPISQTVTEEFAETMVKRPPTTMPAMQPKPSPVQPVAIPIPKPRVHPIFIIILGFTFFVLLFIGSLLSDTFRISTGKAKYPVGITRELGNTVIKIFGIKDKTGAPINLDQYVP